MAENPYMLTPEEQLLYAAQDPAHPFIDPQVVSTPIEFALNPQKYGYRNLAEAGSAVLEKAAPYILYNMSPGGVPVTASRNIAADWQNPYMSGLEKGANTLTNLLGVAMTAAPSQMGQAGASVLNAVGQKVGGYADELAPIMKNVARSEVGAVRLDGKAMNADEYSTFAKNTKVLDEAGNPLKVYHGTASKKKFDALMPNYNKKEQVGFGISFTPDTEFASSYASNQLVARNKGPGRVFYANLDMRNPLDLDQIVYEGSTEFDVAKKIAGKRLFTQTNTEDGRKMAYLKSAIDSVAPQKAEQVLREAGYDGVVYTAEQYSYSPYGKTITAKAKTYVPFDPSQVIYEPDIVPTQ